MRRWTAEEKTALVQQYVALPHGTKAAWLLEQGVKRPGFRSALMW